MLLWGWWINPVDHSHTELIVLCQHPSAPIKFCFIYFLQWEKEWLIVATGNSCRIQTLALSANTAHSWVPLQQLRKQNPPPRRGSVQRLFIFQMGATTRFSFLWFLLGIYSEPLRCYITSINRKNSHKLCPIIFSHTYQNKKVVGSKPSYMKVLWWTGLKKWKNNLRFWVRPGLLNW